MSETIVHETTPAAARPRPAMRRRLRLLAGLAALVLLAAGLWTWHINWGDGIDLAAADEPAPTADRIARGEALARAGNCMACHTARGGAPWAGGRGIATPFGTVMAGNLTPDPDTGLGRWNAAAFRRALHHGRSLDGRLLYPAFPYEHTTRIAREDVDALWVYLRSLPPVVQAAPPHALRWPYNQPWALAVWRALYFRPGRHIDDPAQSTAHNRGAYLVQGPAHCAACHAPRDAWGGSVAADALRGGRMPGYAWYAPSLRDPSEAGLQRWTQDEVVRWLRDGSSERARASGPMAEVVLHGTQHLSDADLQAMATYLRSLPEDPPRKASGPAPVPVDVARRGAAVYEKHCVDCHGERGEGQDGFPALAGNRAVTMADTTNLVQAVLHGGYPPATRGQPRPLGMPPFVLRLDDRDIAAVLTHLRTQWGHQAGEVTALDVHRVRSESGP